MGRGKGEGVTIVAGLVHQRKVKAEKGKVLLYRGRGAAGGR